MFCRKCGSKNEDGAKFCYKCGYAFQQAAVNPAVQPVPTPVQPVPVQPVPTPVQPVPTPVQPVPTPVQPVPTPVQPVPTPVQPVPTPVQSVPTPVQPVPTPVQPVPTPVQPAPTPVQPAPTPVQPVPVQPAPTPVQPVPVQPVPTPVQPAPMFNGQTDQNKTMILAVGNKSETSAVQTEMVNVNPAPIQPEPIQPNQVELAPMPEMTIPKVEPEKDGKKKGGKTALIIVIIVVVLAGLGVGGFFLYRHFTDPSSKAEKALEDDDIAGAVNQLDDASDEERAEIELNIIDKATLEYNNYVNEVVGFDYDSVKEDLMLVKESDISDTTEINRMLENMDVIHESRENYQLGIEASAAGNYIEAVEYFNLVSKEDSKYYASAQEEKDAVMENVKEQYLTTAKEYENVGDYEAAQTTLNEALEVVGNDGDIVAELYTVEGSISNSGKEEAYAELCNTIDNGDYEQAYELLWVDMELYPDDYRFTVKKDELDFAYKSLMFGVAMELYDAGDAEGAVAVLEGMYYYVPGDEAVATWIERYSE